MENIRTLYQVTTVVGGPPGDFMGAFLKQSINGIGRRLDIYDIIVVEVYSIGIIDD
jgi:hypothetical protein